MVVNGQFLGQLNDQFPLVAVVVNCPPFRGAIDCLPFASRHSPPAQAHHADSDE
jgi:hypothetical protein